MTAALSYMRCQYNLVAEMKTKGQLISDTRWESMYKVSTWFKVDRVLLMQYFEERNPVCKPSQSWWLLLLLMAKISTSASITFRSLQGLSRALHAQHQGLLKLQRSYAEMFNASAVHMDKYDKTIGAISDDSSLVVAFSDTEGVLEDLGSFAVETLQNLENEEKQLIFCNVSKCVVNLISSLANIVAERNSMTEGAEKVPPVLPHQLVTLRDREFASILQNQRSRLSERWTDVQIDAIELDFQALCDAYESEDSLKAALDSCDHTTSFETTWNYAQNRFQSLKSFCGGLATAFPGASSDESDFSIVEWEKNERRFSLSDFSLEGIMHAKQYNLLNELQD